MRICHSIRKIATQPVILWILLGGKPKWLPLNFGFNDVVHMAPLASCNTAFWYQTCHLSKGLCVRGYVRAYVRAYVRTLIIYIFMLKMYVRAYVRARACMCVHERMDSASDQQHHIARLIRAEEIEVEAYWNTCCGNNDCYAKSARHHDSPYSAEWRIYPQLESRSSLSSTCTR